MAFLKMSVRKEVKIREMAWPRRVTWSLCGLGRNIAVQSMRVARGRAAA